MEDDSLLRYDFLSRFQFKLDANGFTFSSFSACPEFAPMIRKLIDEYPTSMLAESPVQLRVVPDEKVKPFCHQPSRHPPFEAEAVKKQVDDWLKEGIVLPSTSRFASRTVVVKKLQAQSRTRCDAEEARPWRQKYYS
ncbi:uncharacterized protein LOC117141922 [Drosophila mauritiana]|uniref:Uncharacterized protein LOC117141922 n=1 Tax=Drosophila mauritiana TaxID=7226 RepID=A0A6P8KBD6_DROMA|nr:uncharacterized protein LOC117141922 [Drosophila mauritiana]